MTLVLGSENCYLKLNDESYTISSILYVSPFDEANKPFNLAAAQKDHAKNALNSNVILDNTAVMVASRPKQ